MHNKSMDTEATKLEREKKQSTKMRFRDIFYIVKGKKWLYNLYIIAIDSVIIILPTS